MSGTQSSEAVTVVSGYGYVLPDGSPGRRLFHRKIDTIVDQRARLAPVEKAFSIDLIRTQRTDVLLVPDDTWNHDCPTCGKQKK